MLDADRPAAQLQRKIMAFALHELKRKVSRTQRNGCQEANDQIELQGVAARSLVRRNLDVQSWQAIVRFSECAGREQHGTFDRSEAAMICQGPGALGVSAVRSRATLCSVGNGKEVYGGKRR
jgi:hypothetical protein